ncbi:hypothetical protein KC19_2G135200 [Ceratodon purpureus]|uniref:Uncharacterized protein n=1 Tax=Ceratodon purpureus TaxID=3225 RepID=A0A8T0IVQ0_CERPU|nr:hypothetical protein KC19_2G135200 [Ceratodon purpureus]
MKFLVFFASVIFVMFCNRLRESNCQIWIRLCRSQMDVSIFVEPSSLHTTSSGILAF